MKYKVDWNSPSQGIQSTIVEAIGISQAKEQVESMYAHVKDFRVFSVGYIPKKPDHSETERSHNSGESYSSGGDIDDFSTMIAGGSVVLGFFIALFGLFTLPVGILAMLVGGAIGWVGWKLADWLSDKGW